MEKQQNIEPEPSQESITDQTKQIWSIFVDDIGPFRAKSFCQRNGYIFKGTEEQAKNLFIKLFLDKYNKVNKQQPLKTLKTLKTLKDYFEIEYSFFEDDDDLTDDYIQKTYDNFCKIEQSHGISKGYMLLYDSFSWITDVTYTSIDINDYI